MYFVCIIINIHIYVYKHMQMYVFICYYVKQKLLEFPYQDLASLSYLHITDKYQIQLK